MRAKPDIAWLSLESVRADHTSLHGCHRDTTPHLQRLSERSDATALNLSCSASMWTPASTASILTGTHMSTHQVGRDGKAKKKLPPSVETLPQLLTRQGYETALFSTNPYISSDTGLDRGFDYTERVGISESSFRGFDSVARDSWLSALRRLAEEPTLQPSRLKTRVQSSKNYLLSRRVERWFEERYSRRDPFFAYAHVPSPHHNYRPPAKFFDAYAAEIGVDPDDARKLSRAVYTGSEGIKRRMANGLNLSGRQLEAIEALYDAEIEYADTTAHEIITAARSVSDRPLVIVVTGDHGDLFGERGLIGHNLVLHDGLIRVPVVVAGIDGVEDDGETMSQHVDVTYTLASICSVQSEQFEGRDLRNPERPYAISQRGTAHLDAYTEHNPDFDVSRFFENPVTCVRTPEWKYLESDSRRVLYDLPDEETDRKEAHPEVVEELSEIITTERIDWDSSAGGESVEFDGSTRSQLEDLGYLS